MRRDIGAGPAGGSAVGQGAILEVEAKLGMLVDRNRGERVRIPALTECILAKDDPSIRVGFESSMSLVGPYPLPVPLNYKPSMFSHIDKNN